MNHIKSKPKNGLLRVIFGRTAMVILALLVQVGILLACFSWLSEYAVYYYWFFTFMSAVVLLIILNTDSNASFKIAWIIPVLLIPVFGGILYLFLKLQPGAWQMKKRLSVIDQQIKPYLQQNEQALDKLSKESAGEAGLARYVSTAGGYPVYENTSVKYFPLGEDKFEQLLTELEKAERFIFLEYFIVNRGYVWDTVLEILKRKVQAGVEVRFMYDGMCSFALLPYHYPEEMKAQGLKCKMFSPIRPVLSTYQNNRDHRKILVIDGKVAFTGGINLADEYINRIVRFGHWKDTAIMLKGDAVKSMTLMFLEMWNVTEREDENYEKYIENFEDADQQPAVMEDIRAGFVMPYGDGPFNDEEVAKQVYVDILDRAEHYVHIMTPYLILDDEMIESLTYAAKRGVDTVIIMPHIPDKKYAYSLATTYYPKLIKSGVKIYEYTPGFVHAKVFVSDDIKAVVGSVNLDFRSLYLHFEDAVYIYKNPEVLAVEQDFEDTISKCEQITMESIKRFPRKYWIVGMILKLFAPLM